MGNTLKTNLSNFESKFGTFLSSLNISRRELQELILDFHAYLRALKLNENDILYSAVFDIAPLKKFATLLTRETEDTNRGERFIEIFKQFALFCNETIDDKIDSSLSSPDPIISTFISHLRKRRASASTIRNYRSDLLQFDTFLHIQFPTSYYVSDITIDDTLLSQFESYLVQTLGISSRSAQRKLSAVRTLIKFAKDKGLISYSETETDDKGELSMEPIQPIAINRLSLQFLGIIFLIMMSLGALGLGVWYRGDIVTKTKNILAAADEKLRPGRVVNFQGRLTDQGGTPKTESSNIRFRIYDAIKEGTPLYDSQDCTVTPDQNGIFSTQIGGACGKEIPQTVFTDNPDTYLGVTVGDDEEMAPRQQLATVGYAVNSETVAGLTPESPANSNSIPYLDKDGVMSLAAASPKLYSSSGNFGLVGQSLTIATAGKTNGAINLNPDNMGTINLNFSGVNPASASGFLNVKANNLLTGTLIYGEGSSINSGYSLMQLASGSDKSVKFSVDAAGNINFTGALSSPDTITASAAGFLIKTGATINGQLNDGGLGFFGTRGNRLPTTFDFTKDGVFEFDFKTTSSSFSVQANLNSDDTKYYRFYWDTNSKFGVQKCTPGCSDIASTSYTFAANSWHHGFFRFSGSRITWDIDNHKATSDTTTSSDVPLITDSGIRFVTGVSALSNLKFTPSTSSILTSGSSETGGNLNIRGSANINGLLSSQGSGTQLQLKHDDTNYANFEVQDDGDFIIDPTVTSGKTYIQSDLVVGGSGVFYPSKTSSHDTQTSYFIVADTAGSGSILTNAGSFVAGGTDFAERFESHDSLEEGDVVSISEGSSLEDNNPIVSKASFQTRNSVLGVVSNRAAFIGGQKADVTKNNSFVIGLLGRVPLKVSTQEGPIHVGDPLTSSNYLGVAQLAQSEGPIIARALTEFDPKNQPQNMTLCNDINGVKKESTGTTSTASVYCGTILAFVQYSYFNPGVTLAESGTLTGSIKDLRGFEEIASKNTGSPLSGIIELAQSFKAPQIESTVIKSEAIYTRDIIASGTADLAQIKTNTISAKDTDLTIQIGNSESSNSGSLLLKNGNNDTVASISSSGDATFSGTLYADRINSRQIDTINNSLGELGNKLNSVSDRLNTPSTPSSPSSFLAQIEPTTNNLQPTTLPYQSSSPSASVDTAPSDKQSDLIAEISDFLKKSENLHAKVSAFVDSSASVVYGSFENNPDSIKELKQFIPVDPKFQSLTVYGDASLGNTNVAGNLLVDASTLISGNEIASINETLYLSSRNTIDLLGGMLVLKKDGTLTLDGTLIAKKGVVTDAITTHGSDLIINLASSSGNLSNPTIANTQSTQRIGSSGVLKVSGGLTSEGELSVPSASVAGTLSAKHLELGSGLSFSEDKILTPTDNFISNQINLPGLMTQNSVGVATIPAGYSDIVILNPSVGTKTLLYITPTSKTNSRTIYVSEKIAGKYIKVSLDATTPADITFNWWMIN